MVEFISTLNDVFGNGLVGNASSLSPKHKFLNNVKLFNDFFHDKFALLLLRKSK